MYQHIVNWSRIHKIKLPTLNFTKGKSSYCDVDNHLINIDIGDYAKFDKEFILAHEFSHLLRIRRNKLDKAHVLFRKVESISLFIWVFLLFFFSKEPWFDGIFFILAGILFTGSMFSTYIEMKTDITAANILGNKIVYARPDIMFNGSHPVPKLRSEYINCPIRRKDIDSMGMVVFYFYNIFYMTKEIFVLLFKKIYNIGEYLK